MQDTEPIKALSTELNRLSEIAARDSNRLLLDLCRRYVNLLEEPDAANPQVRFCEGLGPTDTWLR
ncbi:MAG: hypothetical protein Q7J31_15110 [Syntrophales bacterium]|nr:hypothetical protein [Syntrophales bacterium]